MRPPTFRTWVAQLLGRHTGPASVRTRLRLESVEGRVVPSATLPDEPPGGEEVTIAPNVPTPTDLGAPPDPGDTQEPNPNQGRIQKLERQLGMAEGRKAESENLISFSELTVQNLQDAYDRTQNPDLLGPLESARSTLAAQRQTLQGINAEIAGIRQELARLRRGVTDDATGTPVADSRTSDSPPSPPTGG